MKRFAFFIFIFFIIVIAAPKGALATHRQDVLGDATVSLLSPQIPPTPGGPGLLLPDSPFFFLDQAKQDFRVAVAFTPEERAQVYSDVANERLAELRFMLAKNNAKGIRVALEGVYDNFQKASEELDQAKLSGRNISDLSKEVNDLLREHQKALDSLESQATGLLKQQVAVAQKSLLISKLSIEDHLRPADFANEIRYDLQRQGKVVLAESKKSENIPNAVKTATSSSAPVPVVSITPAN